MVAVLGDNYTIHSANGPPASFLRGGAWGGKVRVMIDNYEAVSLVADSTVTVAIIPAYSYLLGMTNICADALGSGCTLSLGISGTAAKFLAAVAFNTAKQRKFIDVDAGLHYSPTVDTAIIILTETAVANGTIKTEVYYSIE